MDNVAGWGAQDRAALFAETAARMNLRPIVAEKDFWVCWVLKRLFSLSGDRPRLLFKGGTSLSKVYGVIARFSEDVDLSLDRRGLRFEGAQEPETAKSRKEAERLIGAFVEAGTRYIGECLLPDLRQDCIGVLGNEPDSWGLLADDSDPQTLNFDYPRSLELVGYNEFQYLRPTVRLEFGVRSDHWPAETRTLLPYAAEFFPEQFQQPACEVRVLGAERTFWEKVTLLHAEYHRPADRPAKQNLSRHYYDVAMLARSPVKALALQKQGLLERVVEHKTLFFRSGWAHYEEAVPGKLRLVPHEELTKQLIRDYESMSEMIFTDPPAFDEVLEELRRLEEEINAVPRTPPLSR